MYYVQGAVQETGDMVVQETGDIVVNERVNASPLQKRDRHLK